MDTTGSQTTQPVDETPTEHIEAPERWTLRGWIERRVIDFAARYGIELAPTSRTHTR